MPPSDPKISSDDLLGADPGKVGLKGILKGGGAQTQSLRPAAMDGFQVADFHRDAHVRNRQDDAHLIEVRKLERELAQAKSEIARLNDRIEKETKASYSQGVQEGHFKGLAEGEKNAEEIWQAQIDVIRKDVAATLDDLAVQNQARYEALRDACVEIALSVAERLFSEEATRDPQLVNRVIAEAFQYLGQEERLRVRVNPLDLTLAEKGGSFWRPVSGAVQSIELVPDPRIDRGGCLVEAEKGGTIDMRAQTLLANMAEAVRAAYSQLKAAEDGAPD